MRITEKQGYCDKIRLLAEKVREADAIVIGGGSGLSSAAGYNHYHWTSSMEEAFQIYRDYYGFKSPMEGYYHCFSNYEEQWGYYCGYIRFLWEALTGQPYLDLKDVIGRKPCFVLTTNVDQQFYRIFPKTQICSYQGDFSFSQCSQPCHDKLYCNYESISEMCEHLEGVKLPAEFVPRCKECGRVLVPWVRDDTFLG